MKNLLIGLLMLVTTNVTAMLPEDAYYKLVSKTVAAEIPPAPNYKVETTHVCNDGLYYYKETSEIHMLVEKMFTYDKLHKKWVHMTCTGA